jgi:hypothetical protein
MHGQCASNACLPDGSCADPGNVAYVDPAGTDNTSCTKAMPCTMVSKALATGRLIIKLHGTTSEHVTINNQNVTLIADPGAQLTSSTTGVILRVDGTSVVAIYNLAIANALGTSSVGIAMPSGNTAILTLRSVSVTGNAGGGISITGGQFDIANSFITQNGGPSSLIGGIDLAAVSGTGTHVIEFTTVASNAGNATVNAGINCGTVTASMTFSDNIIYGNQVSGGGRQLGGSIQCSATYSDIGPDTTAGTGNLNMDPKFVAPSAGDFHITANSTCKDTADPSATLSTDFDGDMRPQGTGRDIGADEYKP